ncbi:hypothetical protein GSI_01984 [Ganoderma sinense ZZ0214-1]|uniref:Uncharacterized protein n=1 Tax=Ganoderma sinense ZZ0214-1 TaxID=1077348 RepID=A0A2G8SND8_9APHY|nr:hypothetical protein GSI_01984 [Ganoderma sinense ZZ0214-1]
MSQRARWTVEGPPGSAFHEQVVLPTFMPHLAREDPRVLAMQEAAPGSPSHEGAEASSTDGSESEVEGVPPPASAAAPEADPHLARRFFVHVTMSRTNVVRSGKTEKREKHEESKTSTTDHPVLAMSRSAFLAAALAAHRLEDRYNSRVPNGPPMTVFWTGSPGGKAHAPTIQTDQEWGTLVRQLRATRRGITTVQVMFNLDVMVPWATLKRPLDPTLHEEHGEVMYGTAVPNVNAYSAEQTARKDAAKQIEKAWSCAVHQGTCYVVPGTLEHVSGRASTAPPPDELLSLWMDKPATVKARGRTGPHAATETSAAPSAGDGGAVQVLTALVPLLTAVVQRGLAPSAEPAVPASPRLSGQRLVPSSPSTSQQRASSPPPEVDEELTRCLDGFARERRMPLMLIDTAIQTLSDHSYTPDSIASVSTGRLQELLPHFGEGQVLALKRFADKWYSRVEAKRARRSL